MENERPAEPDSYAHYNGQQPPQERVHLRTALKRGQMSDMYNCYYRYALSLEQLFASQSYVLLPDTFPDEALLANVTAPEGPALPQVKVDLPPLVAVVAARPLVDFVLLALYLDVLDLLFFFDFLGKLPFDVVNLFQLVDSLILFFFVVKHILFELKHLFRRRVWAYVELYLLESKLLRIYR